MFAQRLLWGGTTITSLVMGFLAFVQVENQLIRWSACIVFGLLFIASMVIFPYGQNPDGSAKRLINVVTRGRNNVTFVSDDGANNTGNVVNTGRGSQTVNNTGLQVTMTEIRQQSLDASRAEVLPAARAVASETAIAEIDRRSGEITDKVIEHLNENPELFARWNDPRFLAALTSAQRSYAETGDEDLADVLAGLVAGLASEPIRTRREIILRQAIDVAPRLTTEHVNALAVNLFITGFKFTPAFDTEALIRALDNFLSPYYGRLPTRALDYDYMVSLGVCDTNQLIGLAGSAAYEPWAVIHRSYPNSIYPAFTFDDLKDDFLSEANRDENHELLLPMAENPEDVVQTEEGTSAVPMDRIRFRVKPELAEQILRANLNDTQQQALSAKESALRSLVLERSLGANQLQELAASITPELANFLETLKRTGTLHYQLHPVGIMIAQHEIVARVPDLADAVSGTFDDNASPSAE